MERANRADKHLGVRWSALRALLDGHDRRALDGPLDLLARLGEELFAVSEDEDALLREASELGEDDRLARAGRQADEEAALPALPRSDDRRDGFTLVRAEGERSRHGGAIRSANAPERPSRGRPGTGQSLRGQAAAGLERGIAVHGAAVGAGLAA
jgi:hypothetical protein